MSKFGMVVACRDPELLRLHLASHLRFTQMKDISFLVVPCEAGAAAKRIDEVVREFRAWAPPSLAGEIRLVEHEGPSYSGTCRHAGAEAAARLHGCDVLVFACESTVVGPAWREVLEQDLDHARVLSGARVGLVGARSNGVSGPQSVFHPAMLPAGIPRRDWQSEMQDPRLASLPPDDPDVTRPLSFAFAWPRILTFLAAVPTESYFAAGGFDVDLPADGGADDTLCLRLLRRGYHNFVSRCFVPDLANPRAAKDAPSEGMTAVVEEDLRGGTEWFDVHYPDREEVVRRELHWTGFR